MFEIHLIVSHRTSLSSSVEVLILCESPLIRGLPAAASQLKSITIGCQCTF